MNNKITQNPTTITTIAQAVETQGFAFVPADEMRGLLPRAADSGWGGFAQSWNDLAEDGYMADGGRYRRRRHAAFTVSEQVERQPHSPHYQSLTHNTLNGGVQRWFEPVADTIGSGDTNLALLNLCRTVFNKAGRTAADYHVEMHQFRIEPQTGGEGKPTPEGIHRDGVDFACVLLVDRVNVNQGITGIFSPEKASLGEFTLATPMDCVFLDDHRVLHGVTPINLIDPARKGFRDVLVLTFTAKP
jgi:hypothetical protein